ncbi:hypothetical protein [Streptomyces sp. A1-5]|uniref:hypothetical protein n=1 Tax=Streptomyces sp. A1-5 TaxID=2738410 RepID=UPI001F438075|nr:hypothetical protein [Streptomyces sp. A1-5]UJB43627.1 hypothetical protein HRD51_25035 [Streptomyces sp. A1-5]
MRDAIARALYWVLALLPWTRRPGRHTAEHLAAQPTPEPAPVSPWSKPWTTPTPQHVIERHTPIPGEESHPIRPYVLTEITLNLRTVCERRRALAAAEMFAEDYPYVFEGSHSASIAAGVAA